jgi:hypothetical protein
VVAFLAAGFFAAFLAAVFLVAAFFAGAFLAAPFFAAAFFAGAFFAAAFFAGAFFAAAFFAGAFFAAAFFAGAFFAAAFFAGAFFAAAFFAGAFFIAAFFAGAFFAVAISFLLDQVEKNRRSVAARHRSTAIHRPKSAQEGCFGTMNRGAKRVGRFCVGPTRFANLDPLHTTFTREANVNPTREHHRFDIR